MDVAPRETGASYPRTKRVFLSSLRGRHARLVSSSHRTVSVSMPDLEYVNDGGERRLRRCGGRVACGNGHEIRKYTCYMSRSYTRLRVLVGLGFLLTPPDDIVDPKFIGTPSWIPPSCPNASLSLRGSGIFDSEPARFCRMSRLDTRFMVEVVADTRSE